MSFADADGKVVRRLVLFGVTGDLAGRYLFPALAHLHAAGRLPPGFRVVGASREEAGTGELREAVAAELERHAPEVPARSRRAVAEALEYRRADASDESAVRELLRTFREPVAVYLALPPRVYEPALRALASVELPESSRVVVEKPFGEDLASARRLNRVLTGAFPEERIFRIDHFLGLPTVQNVLGLRFANRLLEPVWRRDHVESVEITWDETLALEGRAGYYDTAGALKDMLQNHLLQVLCLVAMEPPRSLTEPELRGRKLDVLRAVRPPAPEEAARLTTRARYGAGAIGDRRVAAYLDEAGVDPARETETFARVTLFVEDERWHGVPFTLRSGKALAADRHEVVVRFRPASHSDFPGPPPSPNELRLRLEPDAVSLRLNLSAAGDPFDLEPVELDVELTEPKLPAYAQLLLDVLRGDPTLFVRGDEAEAAWAVVEPVLQAWREGRVPLLEYPAGSAGPPEPSR